MATSRSEDEESLAGPKRGPATPVGTVPKRRSSSRSIKRRRFDDELVESSPQCPPPALPKRLKKGKGSPAPRDLGRWKPADDLLLINAVLQCVTCVTSLLTRVPSSPVPSLDTFQELLQRHPAVFYPARTPKALQLHWQLLRQYHLLQDQPVQPLPKGDQVLNFSDAEELLDDGKLSAVSVCLSVCPAELTVADRRQKREIRQLEQELHRWQVLVDSITGMSSPDFDSQTLAVLRGRMVRYLMRSREVRPPKHPKNTSKTPKTPQKHPKHPQKQGVIKLKNNGDFFIANEGRRPIYIDGRPVLGGNKWKLNNNSVVEIASLRFVFLINHELIALIRSEAARLGQGHGQGQGQGHGQGHQ
ncbi:PREDICTED: microspherule protein 1 [Pseudopodoces humilis]|uniref:microspherule protein 1 n=1 Tax=Pseudopodoces humilis TaxID=181119 RepID=UPI0006B6D60E|nr:PREDICTED: microspherule protein 1 [Pseudopodoces humilis]